MGETTRSGLATAWRRWWLPLSGAIVLALAAWTRAPAEPNIAPFGVSRGNDLAPAIALRALQRELAQSAATAGRVAEAALAVPSEPERAFDALRGVRGPDAEWGVVVYEGDAPLAWSGRIRVPTDTISAPLSVLATPFYTVLVAARTSGVRRAVVVAVVAASPPADRMARSIAGRIAEQHPVSGFTIVVAHDGAVPEVQDGTVPVLESRDGPVLFAQATPLSPGEVRLSTVQRTRVRVAIALGLGLIVFLGIAWRLGGSAERFGAISVALAALAIVPFNALSAQSRLFDPSYFFTRVGGPWTANAGVFLFTSLVVATSAIAMVRGRPRVRSPIAALVVAATLTVLGALFVWELAGGIGQPARGATVNIWLAWQLPLFLSIFAVLLLIAWVVSTGVLHRRTLGRRWFLGLSLGAGIVAASLVWLTTVGQRVRLAEADIAALQTGDDDYLDALLIRFAGALRGAPAPVDRVDLLRLYAESELAIAGYSFALAGWDGAGELRARLDLTGGLSDSPSLAPLVARALNSGEAQLEKAVGPIGHVWLLALPDETGGVTSASVLPRSQLLEPNSFAPLLGLPALPTEEPAYTLSLAETAIPRQPGELVWSRTGYELHSDAPVLTSAGPARIHAEIDLRSPEALGQRLVLILLVNVALAAILMLLVRAAERGFARRARVRLQRWAASYRARLTFALFAFFVIPAVAFAFWGYRRLISDNRHSRQLVVRETLHAARVARADEPIEAIARRLGTPLFSYADGVLTVASDPLLEVLAPLGRTLPPAVHVNLNLADELTATQQMLVSRARILLGYRSTDGGEVLVAPARDTDVWLARRARDLTVLLLFGTAVGALGAFWLSGIAARGFGRPIAALRRAARAVARGERRPPELPRAPSEFEPVFGAFRRMASDLERGRVELARAERVLAWGEMARQVAHEIKNPLTPMRLGVQYLQRARGDPRVDFDKVFQENTDLILAEIERLDEIARAFSKYGSAPTALPPPEPVDVAAVLRDLIAFERMGGGGVDWRLEGAAEPCPAVARREEFREVLMNVFENARGAQARIVSVTLDCGGAGVAITVRDDGVGIPPEVLPRIFEPHFSTRTTGSGLGLAISRRLLDAWGGGMTIQSQPHVGTEVRIVLKGVR